ncbi:hypothetical protein B0H15DRAFT_855377 [Mycena belliarum]|uniref:Uncharacterized protein n=1 Tax=Mycena belliarum TaxID=1033014 RepID=A0AAD6U139_9AGAR|nr:hypothetical protein B0H15DRAFT_855377 [Mycena belliae]
MDSTTYNGPPMTHTIGRSSRQRLVRNMRKVSAVLGETPCLEASARSPSPAPGLLAPAKRGFFYHASASLSSLALPFQKSEPAPSPTTPSERPALVLRLPLPQPFEPLPNPLSPGFSPTLLSPPPPALLSPTTPVHDHDVRRQRMAKVARTLGETVPPALILAGPVQKRRRRASTLILPESALEQQLFAALTNTRPGSFLLARPDAPPPAPHMGQDLDDDASPLDPVHTHPLTPPSPERDVDALLSPAEWLRPTTGSASSSPTRPSSRGPAPGPIPPHVHARSASASAVRGPAPTPTEAPPTYDESHAHGPVSIAPLAAPRPPPKDEWTGAWARGGGGAGVGGGVEMDMAGVVRGLRGLRIK